MVDKTKGVDFQGKKIGKKITCSKQGETKLGTNNNKSWLYFWQAIIHWTWIPLERQTFCCGVTGPPSYHRHRAVQPLQGDVWGSLRKLAGTQELSVNLWPFQSTRNRLPRPLLCAASSLGLHLLHHPGQWWGTGGQNQPALVLANLER